MTATQRSTWWRESVVPPWVLALMAAALVSGWIAMALFALRG